MKRMKILQELKLSEALQDTAWLIMSWSLTLTGLPTASAVSFSVL